MTKTEKIAKAIEAIRSAHVQSVIAAYEYSADEFRFYTCITRYGDVQHKYKVTVQDWFNSETGEMETRAKCQCHAGSKEMLCRHILKVAELDAQMMGREVYPDEICSYKAYQHYQKAA